MGLDLYIREQFNITTDEKGRTTWQTVCLGNLRNCWDLYEEMQCMHDNLANCTTVCFSENEFFQLVERAEENEIKESEINRLKELMEEIGMEQDGERVFEVHVWF